MLYLFDNLEKLAEQVARFKQKNPAGIVYKFDSENFFARQEKLEELLASASGLFGEQRLIVLTDLEEVDLDKEEKEKLTERLKASAAKVLWLERGEKKPNTGKAVKFAKSGFNIFTVTDALGERNRGGLWLAAQKALKAGVSSEEIFWKLVWQVKNMLLVAQTEKAGGEITSLKPFVLSKSRQAAKNYTISELALLSGQLVRVWHETKRYIGRDLALELERLMLNI